MTKVWDMYKATVSMHLSQTEAHTMLTGRLEPQTTYVMRLTQFSEKQCHSVDVIVNRTFLPLLTVNRSTPRAIVHGTLQYGGMTLLKSLTLQDQWGLHYFIQTIRWNQITAQDVLTALDAFQLASGFAAPVMESPELVIDYIADG